METLGILYSSKRDSPLAVIWSHRRSDTPSALMPFPSKPEPSTTVCKEIPHLSGHLFTKRVYLGKNTYNEARPASTTPAMVAGI